ncbi:MAG: DNA primase [Bacteroidetes bacterium]|nr:MAG: DNA primase [Bacteroidota bacterium]MBL1143355.1 DNA primase [Bacteroidota bacterium]NOG56157.1 DNA primase [Bacteroidota bacterium]
MIPKETVDQIIETARVEEVVGDYVNLKKRGANLLGLCPFHNEKTPSFTVSPAKGIYKCFGCGKAGGSVNFIMDHEHFTYPEALKFLANKYNIELEEEELTADQIQQANEKESLFIISQFASEFFQDQLINTDQGKAIGLSYFKERGFREDIIEKFKLGYSPDEWDAFTKTALAKGYRLDYLEKTGLSIVKGEKHFDRFKGRVIFPIQNISGRVIGFGGRTLLADKKTAKYLNSPESEIYHKSNVLYGLNHAKKRIIEQDVCFLVEGYTDVISFHQSGVENVVSSSGTSLTVEQIRLIKRYSQNITILFDGDAAGIKAAFRGIDMILEEGMNVKVLAFPDGEDPDSYAKKHSTSELIEFLSSNAFDFIRFKTNLLLEETGDDPIKRAGLIKEIVGSIALIPDPIARSVYLQECSNLLKIDEQALLSELNKVRRDKLSKKAQKSNFHSEIPLPSEEFAPIEEEENKINKQKFSPTEFQEKDIIRTLIKFGNHTITITVDDTLPKEQQEFLEVQIAEYIVHEVEKDGLDFTLALMQKIYDIFKVAVEKEQVVEERGLISHTDKQISEFVIESLMEKYSLSVNWVEKHNILTIHEEDILDKSIHKGICSWRLNKVQLMIEERQIKLKENPEEYETILLEINRLLEAKKALALELGRIVLN